MQLTHTKKKEKRGNEQKVGMEQELELASRAEATKQFKGKTARTNQTLPVSKRHQQLPDREEWEGRKGGEATERKQRGGENRRECEEGISRKELHSGLGKREKKLG